MYIKAHRLKLKVVVVLLWYGVVSVMFGYAWSVFQKDAETKKTDSVNKSQDASSDDDTDTTSVHQSQHQARHQSAYGAWQTVQQDV